jgi:hypothetical protein
MAEERDGQPVDESDTIERQEPVLPTAGAVTPAEEAAAASHGIVDVDAAPADADGGS